MSCYISKRFLDEKYPSVIFDGKIYYKKPYVDGVDAIWQKVESKINFYRSSTKSGSYTPDNYGDVGYELRPVEPGLNHELDSHYKKQLLNEIEEI